MSLSKVKSLLNGLYASASPQVRDLEFLLGVDGHLAQREIFEFADGVRRASVGEGIFLRGVIEFSNFCRNRCFYCGLHSGNGRLIRYRLSQEEILNSVSHIAESGIKTVVLQSGEDPGMAREWLSDIIRDIKMRFDIAVTLSVGERDYQDYKAWRQAGADRYLLKIETSDHALYSSLHYGMDFKRRLECLRDLKELGYQTGSGNIIGLKGQTLESIAGDIAFFKKEGFEMLGIGPFIPHSETPLAGQQKGKAGLTLRAVALTRIVLKSANIPATTALGIRDADYRARALRCGANVLMVNFTPREYRGLYQIYPGKGYLEGVSEGWLSGASKITHDSGRFIDYSRGDAALNRGEPEYV